jgi:Flp pilus assembly protein TadG
MKNTDPARKTRRRWRAHRRKGAEVLEFTFVFLPMLAMILVLIDICWAVFAKSTLEYAVRTGVRTGITITGTQATAAGGCLTDIVKGTVKRNSLGLLPDTSKIKVNYFLPSGTSAAPTDVSTNSDGNKPLNIMQVSIQGYALRALAPRIWNWRQSADVSASAIYAASADLIEASRDVPCIGTAP